MLPSKGYFKALDCPYYGESYCDRPYCHFKHSRQDPSSSDPARQDVVAAAAETEDGSVVAVAAPGEQYPTMSVEEPKAKQHKAKSKVIEYVPQFINPKHLDPANKPSIFASTTDDAAAGNVKETPIPEYIPSRVVNDTNYEPENVIESPVVDRAAEPLGTTVEGVPRCGTGKRDGSERVPSYAVEKPPVDSKTNRRDDKREKTEHGSSSSSSKRKHEFSRSSSKSSSSSKSKKSKRDKSQERKKHKKERAGDKEKSEKRHSRDRNGKRTGDEPPDVLITTISASSGGPKSLKEAIREKVKKKLVEPEPVKIDLNSSSDEGNGPSTASIESDLAASIESDLAEFFGSEDSGNELNEQKTCNVVEAKVKKRISHISSTSIFAQVNAQPIFKPRSTRSLHEMVANRVKNIQNNNVTPLILPKQTTNHLNNDPTIPMLKSKSRVAHQPKIEPVTTSITTESQTPKVNSKEITANVKMSLRLKSFKSSNNMPNPLRQSCLEKLFAAFINHYSSEEAIDKAHATEDEVHNKAKSSGVYRNLIVQSLLKANKSPELQIKSNPNYPSHMYGICLYDLLRKYILTQEELEKNGYPLMGDNELAYISKDAYYYRPLSKKRNGDKFVCMNCKSEFEVNKRGMPIVTLSKCIYHSGKLKFERAKNEKFWLCCYRRQHESGCETSVYHMPDKFDEDALEHFVEIKSNKSNKNVDEPNFFALDCEMVNTTVGIEIVRVTVIDHEGKEVYESKVKPFNPILDYKSKYSGITEESLKHCSKRLFEVQLDLLKLFDKNSILIGHSLESDLKALKMVHTNVVDTSIMYPHKYGPPYKWGLKLLSEQHLQRIIQSEEGHDSKEDALASLDLVWKKLKEDVKKFKPINIISFDKK